MAKWNTVELAVIDSGGTLLERYNVATLLYTGYNDPDTTQYYIYHKAGAIDLELGINSEIYAAIVQESAIRTLIIYSKSNNRGRCEYFNAQGYGTPSSSYLNVTQYKPDGLDEDAPFLYTYMRGQIGGWSYLISDLPVYNSLGELYYDVFSPPVKYPITYSATNGTVTGPEEAAVGETVVATGTPNANYGITDYTTQISVTCNDIPVPFTYNATTNEITFEMPDPTSG